MNNIIYKAISGSKSYGVATPDSDSDALGVFMQRPEHLLGISKSDSTYSNPDSDETYKSLSTFIKFAKEGSSFWVEPLFVRESDILILDPAFEPFLKQRDIFLTQALVLKSLGFISGMVNESKKVDQGKPQTESQRKRSQKNLYHAVRVSRMLLELLNNFSFRVYRPEDREHLLKIKTGIISKEDALEEVGELLLKIEEIKLNNKLPYTADENLLNSLLVSNIQKYWVMNKWV